MENQINPITFYQIILAIAFLASVVANVAGIFGGFKAKVTMNQDAQTKEQCALINEAVQTRLKALEAANSNLAKEITDGFSTTHRRIDKIMEIMKTN